MPLSLNFFTIAAAVGRLRGSGGKVISTPSPAGPVMEANSREGSASPAIRMVFNP
jgi:hypothetical protein